MSDIDKEELKEVAELRAKVGLIAVALSSYELQLQTRIMLKSGLGGKV